MPTTHEKTSLLDFGSGMLCGMVLNGVYTLSEQRLSAVHEGFKRAFDFVEAELDERMMFYLIIGYHGTSPIVDNVFNWWLQSGYAYKEAPGYVYHFKIGTLTAVTTLESIPGGKELYQKAAKVLTDFLGSEESFAYRD